MPMSPGRVSSSSSSSSSFVVVTPVAAFCSVLATRHFPSALWVSLGAPRRAVRSSAKPGTLPVPEGPPRRHPGSFLGLSRPGTIPVHWVGLGALPALSEVFWPRHLPGALRAPPGAIPAHLRRLGLGAPATARRMPPDCLTSHAPE